MRDILLSLLRHPNEKTSDELIKCNNDELKVRLHKRLFNRRYMIVLDDIWSKEVWDEIKLYFPDNNNGSRIVITSRESHVAKYVAESERLHHMQLLTKSSSWDLLCQVVFGKEDCPLELQGIGAKNASDCGGLPLAIQVIGGLLSKKERSTDVWEQISSDVRASIVESEEQFSTILSLSYNHLPIYLKPCFLYMGVLYMGILTVDDAIKVSGLMSIWIAEGFVKCNGDKSLEEVAEDYLKVLVERNLLSVVQKKTNGKPRCYSMHDLLRDLCIRKAKEEKFLLVKNSMRRLSVKSSHELEDVCASPQLMSLARSFICTHDEILSPILGILRLVRVLDVISVIFEKFPEEILQLVNLRFLAFSCTSGFPVGISRLWNLQTLVCGEEICYLPSEIWELSELRYLRLFSIFKMDEENRIRCVHKKLHTISFAWVTPSLIRSGFFETIPNIIKLEIYYIDSPGTEVDLSRLHKLQTLKCRSELDKDGSRFLHKLRFPSNLRKLSLVGCVVSRSFLTTLCALPNLEVLKIVKCEFQREGEAEEEEWEATEGEGEAEEEEWEATEGEGEAEEVEWEATEGEGEAEEEEWEATEGEGEAEEVEWEATEGEGEAEEEEWEVTEGEVFRSLQCLYLQFFNIVRWKADESNFPKLEHLILCNCHELEEIPSAIGDIASLQEIEIHECGASVAASAHQIKKVQIEESGNDDLKVSIR